MVRETFPLLDARAAEKVILLSSAAEEAQELQVTQTLYYSGAGAGTADGRSALP